jgi:ABC-type uncharacterized transport system fused permease/ATPase subunit
MRTLTAAVIAISCLSLTGCSYLKQQPKAYIKQSSVCIDRGWYGYHQNIQCPYTTKHVTPDASQEMSARFAASQTDLSRSQEEKDRLAAELAAAKQRIMDLEMKLDRSNESLTKAERHLLKALQPEISKGTLSVNQSE